MRNVGSIVPAVIYAGFSDIINIAAVDTKGTATLIDDTVADYSSQGRQVGTYDRKQKKFIVEVPENARILLGAPLDSDTPKGVQGTSFTVSNVVQTIAYIRALDEDSSAEHITDILIKTAHPGHFQNKASELGYGIHDDKAALQQAFIMRGFG